MLQSEIIFSVQEAPEGGYQARALGFSIFTEADTIDELRMMIREAVSCHFENGQKPSFIRLHMVKDVRLEAPRDVSDEELVPSMRRAVVPWRLASLFLGSAIRESRDRSIA